MVIKEKDLLQNKSIENIIDEMSLEAKIGQLVMVGFHGPRINQSIKEMIEDYQIGGIIYFARNLKNPAQTAALSSRLQSISLDSNGLPLFISTDEEGGIVTRVKGMTHFPGPMSLGAADTKDLTKKAAREKGRQLKYLGINFNLSPVLDVNINPDNPIVGVRSFGSQPEEVSKLGVAYVEGMQSSNVTACAKHFPGHGDTKVDSHLELPIIDHDMERLEDVELRPFRKAIETGIDSIMSAHISFPALSEKVNLPATLSYKILTGLLREELGFNGLIITDCMEMNGIVDTYGTAEGAVKAIQAGADQVLISHTPLKQIEALQKIKEAVDAAKIKESQIDRSLERILKLKQKRISSDNYNSFEKDQFSLYVNQGDKIAKEVSLRSITILGKEKEFVPLDIDVHKDLLVIDISEGKTSPVENPKEKEGWNNKEQLIYKLRDKDFRIKDKLLKVTNRERADRISLVKELKQEIAEKKISAVILLLEDYNQDSIKEDLINHLSKEELPVVVLCQNNPYSARKINQVPVILTYDNSPVHIGPLIEVLTGKRKPEGKLPIN